MPPALRACPGQRIRAWQQMHGEMTPLQLFQGMSAAAPTAAAPADEWAADFSTVSVDASAPAASLLLLLLCCTRGRVGG